MHAHPGRTRSHKSIVGRHQSSESPINETSSVLGSRLSSYPNRYGNAGSVDSSAPHRRWVHRSAYSGSTGKPNVHKLQGLAADCSGCIQDITHTRRKSDSCSRQTQSSCHHPTSCPSPKSQSRWKRKRKQQRQGQGTRQRRLLSRSVRLSYTRWGTSHTGILHDRVTRSQQN